MNDPHRASPPADPTGSSAPSPSGGDRSGRTDPFMVGLFVVLIVGIAAFGWMLSRIEPATAPEVGPGATVLPEPIPLPEFRLVDHEGRPFERPDFEGDWSLVFFGYSACPDVCPFVLGQLVQVKRSWPTGDEAGPMPRVVFISVDPDRDSPERLREYVPFFDVDFRGVSGPTREIDTLTKELGVFYALRRADEQETDYLVDHAAKLWLIDPQARLAAILDDPHEPAPFIDLIERIRALRGDLS